MKNKKLRKLLKKLPKNQRVIIVGNDGKEYNIIGATIVCKNNKPNYPEPHIEIMGDLQ